MEKSKTDWANVKKRLKKAMDQGMKILKEGTAEAKYMAGQTAHFLQLEMDVHNLKSRIEATANRLGHEIHKAMRNGRVSLTPEIKKINADLTALEATLKKKEYALKHTSVIRK